MALTGRLAREQGSTEGYRTIVNTGRIGRQDVMHLHVHVIGGPKPLGVMLRAEPRLSDASRRIAWDP